MAQTRPNKIVTITNDEIYDLATHQARLADSASVVVGVSGETERNGLAALYPGGVLPIPYYVSRKDVVGAPIEIWDGSGWSRQVDLRIYANTQTVGSGMSTLSFLTGTLRPILQAGTFVGTTSGSGDLTITYPTQFPGGVIGGIGFSGDGVYIVSATPSNVAMPTTSSLFLRFAHPNGAAVASTPVRGTWFALGW